MRRAAIIIFLAMDVIVTLAVLAIVFWILANPADYDKDTRTAAFGALGTVVSFWFGSGVGAVLLS